jgi:hypothetical protein
MHIQRITRASHCANVVWPDLAAERLIDGIHKQICEVKATESTGAKGFIRVTWAIGHGADGTLRDRTLAQGLFQNTLDVPLRHPARVPLDAQPGQPIIRPSQGGPPFGALRCVELPDLGELEPEHPLSGFHRAVFLSVPISP